MEWIGYGTPLTAAKEYMDPEMVASPVAYPDEETLKNATSFAFLPPETSRFVEKLFMQMRNQ